MSADFFAGYVSGAAGIIVGNPLDLIKVRLQAGASSFPVQLSPAISTSARLSPSLNPPTSPPRPSASARTLFKGLPAPVLTYGALNALLFTTYNRSLLLLSQPFPRDTASPGVHSAITPNPSHAYWSHFVAGCVAGLATFIISTPTEIIKCRAQLAQDLPSSTSLSHPVSGSSSSSSWSIVRSIYQQNGLYGFYHGGVITSVRDAVGYGFYFLTYEASKDLWDSISDNAASHKPGDKSNGINEAAKVLLCGGVAGVATWVSIFPLDVIKTRVQTQPQVETVRTAASEPTLSTPLRQNPTLRTSQLQVQAPASTWSIARQAYRTEGISVFFRGMTVCCVRAFIVNAVQWTVYEWIMRYLTP